MAVHLAYLAAVVSVPMAGLGLLAAWAADRRRHLLVVAGTVALVPAVVGVHATHVAPFQLEVDHQEDVRGLDFAAALASASTGTPVDGPLYLVCTHGKRDRCCARYGRPLYDALRERAGPDGVWHDPPAEPALTENNS